MTAPAVNASTALAYREDIDGLRALAVLSIVLFHIDTTLVPGGFVGVDIFLVISGFLITSIIRRKIAAGTFSFADFYRRRVLRIAPAYVASTLATLAAGCFLMLPDDLAALGRSALWSAVSLPNVYFWRFLDTSYFAEASNQVPLLHLWSLGVEEQFYLLWPALLLILCKLFRSWLVIAALDKSVNSRLARVARKFSRAHYMDVSAILCPGSSCSSYLDGVPVYNDPGHMSLVGFWQVGGRMLDGKLPLRAVFYKLGAAAGRAARVIDEAQARRAVHDDPSARDERASPTGDIEK